MSDCRKRPSSLHDAESALDRILLDASPNGDRDPCPVGITKPHTRSGDQRRILVAHPESVNRRVDEEPFDSPGRRLKHFEQDWTLSREPLVLSEFALSHRS